MEGTNPSVVDTLSSDPSVRRKMFTILRILSEADAPIGARNISQELKNFGTVLSERQVRYYLEKMDERGLTESRGQAGRVLTESGQEELDNALVSEKVGFVAAKIEDLAYATDFDLQTGAGNVVLNVSYVPRDQLSDALDIMRPVVDANLCISDLILIDETGEEIAHKLPEGMAALGTVCSVTVNGVLLHQAIPLQSRYGGLLEMRGGNPYRFTELVSYAGTSVDPLQIFITGRMTAAYDAAMTGDGKVGAGFRELPAAALPRALDIIKKMSEHRLGGVLTLGAPGQPLLDISVGLQRAGLVLVGGLTPLAAVAEQGIDVVNKAMSTTCELSRLQPLEQVNG